MTTVFITLSTGERMQISAESEVYINFRKGNHTLAEVEAAYYAIVDASKNVVAEQISGKPTGRAVIRQTR